VKNINMSFLNKNTIQKCLSSFLFFVSPVFSQPESIFLSCDTKSMTMDFKETQEFQKNERVIGLEINRGEGIVIWGNKKIDFVEDYNEDNIYELNTNDETSTTDIDFNRVTGRLVETLYYFYENKKIHSVFRNEYQCSIKEPLFER
tara:strand:+ start:1152 stop:1589 length:438 start_codon:yes stop_codon:yes gene_type:complete